MAIIDSLKKYFSLVTFSHTIFAMPFAFIGFFIGVRDSQTINWKIFIYIILCMIFARNAAMGFNRYTDRYFDKKNPRTASREIPAGRLRALSVLIFVIVNASLFIVSTWFINSLVFYLSPIALLVILCYSLTKRFTALSHFILGLGLSLAPIGAYLSVNGNFSMLPILYSLVVIFWVSGFDIIYALQDKDFDKNENLKSLPVHLGNKAALNLSLILHSIAAVIVLLAGFHPYFGFLYLAGALLFIGLLFYQHTLVKPDDLSRLNMAFFTTNGIASVIFAIFTIIDLMV
ncbi:MAG: putative 4-hydroxybenzoate polyprenyltransferase [Bacteroidia bacterium]|nr:putative 4-hydroxybenzoate polyprenyltransferase [Bacteroidia bacterium]